MKRYHLIIRYLCLKNKFTSLSLAFKTDKITLEKRLEIQERSRDIAEENVAKEIKGLREALEVGLISVRTTEN